MKRISRGVLQALLRGIRGVKTRGHMSLLYFMVVSNQGKRNFQEDSRHN